MDASFFVNEMQVDFASVLAMEHTGIARMFKTLEDTRLKGFLAASSSVYENSVVEFFANAKIVVEMWGRFFGSDVPFRAPSKKNDMKMEFHLLHDIVAKALCAKVGPLTWLPVRTEGQIEEIDRIVEQVEDTAKEHLDEEDQSQQSSSYGSSARFSVHNENSVDSFEANNTDHQGPSPSNLQMIVYNENREENNSSTHDKGSTQASPQQVLVSSPQENPDVDVKFKEMQNVFASLDYRSTPWIQGLDL
ncbi:hypothetical protein F511_13042 [Dorcoceras hygrometricum]|uniref:Uncharacterized protein n=1 Tax=Dorcoceras hygrometricum TaxID=472368 RepID=A0A2Z7BGI7_9LAMI|nr:hypothetical protein F511_13042 [Dorcoceras hygrometricum]